MVHLRRLEGAIWRALPTMGSITRERITTSVLISLLLLTVLCSPKEGSFKPMAAWAALPVRLIGWSVGGGTPQDLQDARAVAAAERFGAALAAWLPDQAAGLALLDDVAAGRKQSGVLADVRVLIAHVWSNGLGNRLPSLVTALAVAMLTDRVLLVSDAEDLFYIAFTPDFDCRATLMRLETLDSILGKRQVRARTVPRPAAL